MAINSLTYQRYNGGDGDLHEQYDHVTVLGTATDEQVRAYLMDRVDPDLLYQYYVTEYDGDPDDPYTDIVAQTNAELWVEGERHYRS